MKGEGEVKVENLVIWSHRHRSVVIGRGKVQVEVEVKVEIEVEDTASPDRGFVIRVEFYPSRRLDSRSGCYPESDIDRQQ